MKKYLVIGNPIEHSLSPKIHNFWIKKNNINAIYEKKKIENDELEKLIMDVKKNNINGINVTVPFKKKIIPYLDNLSLEAQKTKSVNTIYCKNDKIIGHNTDIEGFEFSVQKTKFDLTGKTIFILGAGGVAASIIFALYKMNVSKIILANRTKNKANYLKDMFNNLHLIEWGEIPEFDMIINATSLGLKKHDKFNLDFSKVGKEKFFYDLIYNPQETNFLNIGKNMGNKTQNGKMMFVYQAQAAFKIWHGVSAEINEDVMKFLDQ